MTTTSGMTNDALDAVVLGALIKDADDWGLMRT